MSDIAESLVEFVRDHYQSNEFIPLHAPVFRGNEKRYVADTISSTFVSSVGEFVSQFERDVAGYTGSEAAVATVNGTAALHICLKLAGVGQGDLVLTQALTFVATCNAIHYCNAEPVFIDVSRSTLGMCPDSLAVWLEKRATFSEKGACIERESGKRISACLPMHTFGHPCDLDRLVAVCKKWGIPLVEDAAESLGSFYKGRHTGTFGMSAAISFNGNKIITTGGGGMILSDLQTAARAKHLTTTAKKAHAYEYVHDEVGFNYRLPNINAALGVAQMQELQSFLEEKRALAERYRAFFSGSGFEFVDEPAECTSNFWLNAVLCPSREDREQLLKETNESGVMSRPVWQLMKDLPMYQRCMSDGLKNSRYIADRLVNLPSSVKSG
ncbi:LegC family aminotransferase [Marinobacter koreensis]|jgi:aminotransferase in exopolysaccharide biosynthesis|uniref:LegC family aminotransferase n=1 Tax=Marinobacter koreensis TaxID=335974 RepID=A0ABW0RK32_9GAMM|nr:LegC family aminotransferase [Marinobacter koreensis]MCK7546999.1 LegC family aminotransferase [Marinobacter koreensis]